MMRTGRCRIFFQKPVALFASQEQCHNAM
uniref:Uncharacterized protein n=1 Tax=Arundo donax TaxID=35708 RepID=A0A0A9EH66_ARUDO